MLKSKRTLIFFLALLLFYTRFVNLSWGLPYPLHPDERNMANAIQDLNNLHFFAYGQFPLYLGYGGVQIFKFFDGDLGTPIGFQEAVISLRILSALASVLTAIIVVRLVGLFFHPNFKHSPFFVLLSPFFILIFSPALIQFSHFGTTESLLMFFYTAVVYVSLLYLKNRISNKKFILASSLLVGLAIGTKISSVIFLLLPLIILLWQAKTHRGGAYGLVGLLILTTAISVIVSPQNIISFDEFANSIRYESDVALGSRQVFYTRQFSDAIPIVFQFAKIFPYALGWPVFLAFLVGFFVLPYSRIYNFLRLAFLLYFLPNAFLYAKWTRFMAPVLPLMIVLASLALVSVCHPRLVWTSDMLSGSAKCHSGLSRICRFWMRFFQSLTRMTISRFRNKFGMTLRKLVFYPLLFASVVPGIAFLSIYTNPDVRLAASEWIYKNIPKNSYILSETANVVDLPL
ncbi:glycosyltransferase family 39 protein, partial [Candidatus Roizmanbacteria bacterium]|nr:glycosyltransferase family 39 protein [Candidatus Roizmanbacteria bacterium]